MYSTVMTWYTKLSDTYLREKKHLSPKAVGVDTIYASSCKMHAKKQHTGSYIARAGCTLSSFRLGFDV